MEDDTGGFDLRISATKERDEDERRWRPWEEAHKQIMRNFSRNFLDFTPMRHLC